MIFLNFCPKSKFFDNNYLNRDFRNFELNSTVFQNYDRNRDFRNLGLNFFSKILTEIKISEVLKRNRDLKNFGQTSKFSKFWTEIDFFKNCDQNRDFRNFGLTSIFFSKSLTETKIFEILVRNRKFWTILTVIEILEILDWNLYFFQNFWPKWRFLIFFFQNRNFSKILPEIKLFFKCETKIDIFKIFDWN